MSIDERADNDFEMEQITRMTVLEVLYADRRRHPERPGVFLLDLERLSGRAREHLEFTTWYLLSKRLVQRSDNSRLAITADGVDYLEQHYLSRLKRKRIAA